VCKCVLYYCHRVTTQLQLTNISYKKKPLDFATALMNFIVNFLFISNFNVVISTHVIKKMFTSHRLCYIALCFYTSICFPGSLKWLKQNRGVAEESVCSLPADYFSRDSSHSEEDNRYTNTCQHYTFLCVLMVDQVLRFSWYSVRK
jgi:hypothetical protein